jgi:purine-nucleoside phosphorylase
MSDLEPLACLKRLAQEKPTVAIALGSGLGPVAQGLHALFSVPYTHIAGLIAPSVPGHKGCVTLCKWGGNSVLVLEGRLHSYEGHFCETITRPIQLAHSLGARVFLSTNAAGGIHPRLSPGSFMMIRDHVDWTRPVVRRTEAASLESATEPSPYSARLLQILHQEANRLSIDLFSGIYAAVTGPNYETPAEIRALRHCGIDAVGMSTIHEIEAAHHLGMECAAISCITNRAAGLDEGAAITHDEVLQTANAASDQLARLIEACIERISTEEYLLGPDPPKC